MYADAYNRYDNDDIPLEDCKFLNFTEFLDEIDVFKNPTVARSNGLYKNGKWSLLGYSVNTIREESEDEVIFEEEYEENNTVQNYKNSFVIKWEYTIFNGVFSDDSEVSKTGKTEIEKSIKETTRFLEKTFSNHLVQFLERIGIMWITGTINPGQEHFITHLIRQKLISETALLPVPDPKSPKVLLFLPEYEWHELSLLFYHYMLRSNGVHSFYLGQSLPYDAVIECVERLNPKALLTSVLTATETDYYENLFKKMRKDLGDQVDHNRIGEDCVPFAGGDVLVVA